MSCQTVNMIVCSNFIFVVDESYAAQNLQPLGKNEVAMHAAYLQKKEENFVMVFLTLPD